MNYSSITIFFVTILLTAFTSINLIAQEQNEEIHPLNNPITEDYLQENLRKQAPRIMLTPAILERVRQQVDEDEAIANYYAAVKLNAEEIQQQPLLERKKIGRRLLSTSREMLYRMGVLGMTYLIESDWKVLDRINDELLAICQFSDWNPSHYLDVAEMSLALAIAIDWVGEALPASTVSLVKQNLVEKGINPSYNPDGNVGWIKGSNNWNQVCHAGMIAASIAVAEEEPELAAKTIHRALDGIPYAMKAYLPDGIYPEGSTYWGYGTSFSVMTSSMLETAFNTDFGLAQSPAFIESADFRLLANTPSGMYYNFADCGDRRSENADIVLAWFATYLANPLYFERDRLLRSPEAMGKLPRLAGPALIWMSQYEPEIASTLPTAWKGDGDNPVVIFTGDNGYYFGGKGGRGTVNHGNMDAGSFIFELNGVRWVLDPGNQGYHDLEKTGFNLWGRCQDCERWTLLTKNNYGHSTITVNGQLHVVDGKVEITDFVSGPQPSASLDMSPSYGENLDHAKRTFSKPNDSSLEIIDEITVNDKTEMITWQLMTAADVELSSKGAITLHQDGKSLQVQNISHPEIAFSVISLDPPPLELDRKIPGLKRLELRLPAYLFDSGQGKVHVRLMGN